jgi:hypothetical protein
MQTQNFTLNPNPLRMRDHLDHIFVTGHLATAAVNRMSFSVKEYALISKLFKSTQVTKQMLRYQFSFSVSLLSVSTSDRDVKTIQKFQNSVAINPVKYYNFSSCLHIKKVFLLDVLSDMIKIPAYVWANDWYLRTFYWLSFRLHRPDTDSSLQPCQWPTANHSRRFTTL